MSVAGDGQNQIPAQLEAGQAGVGDAQVITSQLLAGSVYSLGNPALPAEYSQAAIAQATANMEASGTLPTFGISKAAAEEQKLVADAITRQILNYNDKNPGLLPINPMNAKSLGLTGPAARDYAAESTFYQSPGDATRSPEGTEKRLSPVKAELTSDPEEEKNAHFVLGADGKLKERQYKVDKDGDGTYETEEKSIWNKWAGDKPGIDGSVKIYVARDAIKDENMDNVAMSMARIQQALKEEGLQTDLSAATTTASLQQLINRPQAGDTTSRGPATKSLGDASPAKPTAGANPGTREAGPSGGESDRAGDESAKADETGSGLPEVASSPGAGGGGGGGGGGRSGGGAGGGGGGCSDGSCARPDAMPSNSGGNAGDDLGGNAGDSGDFTGTSRGLGAGDTAYAQRAQEVVKGLSNALTAAGGGVMHPSRYGSWMRNVFQIPNGALAALMEKPPNWKKYKEEMEKYLKDPENQKKIGENLDREIASLKKQGLQDSADGLSKFKSDFANLGPEKMSDFANNFGKSYSTLMKEGATAADVTTAFSKNPQLETIARNSQIVQGAFMMTPKRNEHGATDVTALTPNQRGQLVFDLRRPVSNAGDREASAPATAEDPAAMVRQSIEAERTAAARRSP